MNSITIKEENSKKGKIVAVVVIILIVAILVGAIIGRTDSKGIKIDTQVEQVLIEDGQSSFDVAKMLKEKGIIKYPYMFVSQSIMGGYHGNFQGGILSVENGMSYKEILDMLIVPSRNTIKVVVAPGEEMKEISKKLNDLGLVPWQDFYGALSSKEPYISYSFVGNIPARDNLFEGYLYPATYEISKEMTSYNVGELMLDTFNKQFSNEYYNKAQEMGLTTDELIILASIVEREAPSGADLQRIANVYFNRYKAGFCLEALGSIQYMIGERKPVLSTVEINIDSPYNTFVHQGLPAGAICSPSKETIEAVLNYSPSDEYYYALREDGTTIFATNYNDFKTQLDQAPLAITVDTDVFKNQDDKKPQ
ncbi:MAG: endolytic transglycosylase MltG [Clostridia bacterium]|nr:endolytic transglycosylase MltG [Clostridia bacterium]